MASGSTADISPVPIKYRGRVINNQNAWIESGIYVGQLVLYAVIAFLPVILGGLLATGQLLSDLNLGFAPVVVGFALAAAIGWYLFGQLFKEPWTSDYVFNKIRNEFRQRPERIVEPDNPDAILTEIIPRKHWGMVMLQKAEDRGFLLLDKEQREVVFEGDHKRYRIPNSAILSLEVVHTHNTTPNSDYEAPVGVVVVTIRDKLGEREIPFKPLRTVSGESLGTNPFERADELHQRLEAMLGGGESTSR